MTSYMKQNKKCKNTLKSVQYGLEIIFKSHLTNSNWLILLSRCIRNLKLFRVNRNRSWTCQAYSRDIIGSLSNDDGDAEDDA